MSVSNTNIKIENKIKIKPKHKRRRLFTKVNKRPLYIFLFSFLLILVVVGTLATYYLILPAQRVMGSVNVLLDVVENLKQDLEGKDLRKIDGYFDIVTAELATISAEVDNYQFLQDIEFTRGYYQNLQVTQTLALRSSGLVSDVLPDIKVLLKSMGYQVDTDVEGESADEEVERLNALVKELPNVVSLYEEKEPEIIELIEIFNQIDPEYIPKIGTGSVRDRIVEAQQLTLEFPAFSAQMKDTLGIMPTLLGSKKAARYLIIIQNEKEMRASGGLLSAFANLTVKNGEFSDEIDVIGMWKLERYVSWQLGIDVGYRNIYGQNALMNSGCGSNYLRAQDSGIYPDLHVAMEMFRDYYDVARQYDPKTYPAYDHIIIFNTYFVSDLVEFVEPIKVKGFDKEITSKNIAKEITFQLAEDGTFVQDNRKEFIGEVATVLKEEFTSMSADQFLDVTQSLIRTIQARNIAFYSKNKNVQAYFDEFGLSGRFEQNFAGDYLHINEAQNCALKANFYIRDSVDQTIRIDKNGNVKHNLKITWTNNRVYDPKEKTILSNSIKFRYRAWVRVMAPKGTEFTFTDGYEKSLWFYWPVAYFDDVMKKEVSDNVIWFDHRRPTKSSPPTGTDLNIEYKSPKVAKYTKDQGYRLLLQKHPGKKAEPYNITIIQGGKKTSVKVLLKRDKVVSYNGGVITVEDYDTRLDYYYDLIDDLKNL